jgi:hypothetical protein
MQSDSDTSTKRNAHISLSDVSVDTSIAAIAMELDYDAKGKEEESLSSNNNEKISSPDTSMQSSSNEDSNHLPHDQHKALSVERFNSRNCTESDARDRKLLTDLEWHQASRIQNPSLLLDDLKELGMVGELSEDNKFVNMSFEDVHRLVMTMKMAKFILKDSIQSNRKDKIEQIKVQLDAEHCPDMSTLLRELEKAKHDLTQQHSFQSVGVFEPGLCSLKGFILFETMTISKGID